MSKKIERKDWKSNFYLIGEAVVNDFSFKTDEKSNKSDWIYNALNLGINCGEKFGVVYADCMGGYGEDRENVIYAFGRNEDGSSNFDEKIIVAWEDRFNESILEKIGDASFIKVGLETTDKGKVFYKNFLSEYDAIAYVKEHLTNGMVINVSGNLNYSEYQGNTQTKKNIKKIELSIDKATGKLATPDKYGAYFTQSVLIDKDSASLKNENIDKDKGVIFVDTIVLDYLKEKDGVEIKGWYPYKKRFEFPLDLTNQALCKIAMDKLFKVKKGYTQITFEGEFVEGGAVVAATLDDVPDEIKELIGVVFTEEEVLARCSSNGSRERRMLLKKPYFKLVGEEKTAVLQKFEEQYAEEDLIFDFGTNDDVPFDVDDNTTTTSSDTGDLNWLSQL